MNTFRLSALAACLAISPAFGAATLTGLWQLNGDLSNSVGGGTDLVATGWTPTFSSVLISAAPSDVLAIPGLPGNQLLTFVNTIDANGNGTRTNDFSLAWDVNFRVLQTIESLLQTDTANADDTDVYLYGPDGHLAIAGTAASSLNSISADTWYRIVMTSENYGGLNHTNFYVDGALTGPDITSGVDGLISLSQTGTHLFSDNSGDTGDAYLNSFAVWNGVLTASEISSMGSASSAGFTSSVPEPGVASLGFLGLAAILTRRRRR